MRLKILDFIKIRAKKLLIFTFVYLKILDFKNFTPEKLLIFYASKNGIFSHCASVPLGFLRMAQKKVSVVFSETNPMDCLKTKFYNCAENKIPLTLVSIR